MTCVSDAPGAWYAPADERKDTSRDCNKEDDDDDNDDHNNNNNNNINNNDDNNNNHSLCL